MDILVIKNSETIVISQNGKKLIIKKDNELFEQLNKLEKEEIMKWYINRNK